MKYIKLFTSMSMLMESAKDCFVELIDKGYKFDFEVKKMVFFHEEYTLFYWEDVKDDIIKFITLNEDKIKKVKIDYQSYSPRMHNSVKISLEDIINDITPINKVFLPNNLKFNTIENIDIFFKKDI